MKRVLITWADGAYFAGAVALPFVAVGPHREQAIAAMILLPAAALVLEHAYGPVAAGLRGSVRVWAVRVLVGLSVLPLILTGWVAGVLAIGAGLAIVAAADSLVTRAATGPTI